MSHLTENITFHTLINEDKLYCLYCKSRCWTFSSSSGSNSQITFTCSTCDERFIHNSFMFNEQITSFEFTCNDLYIHIYYGTENFSLRKLDSKEKVWINDLHNMKFDFSNKEKLYNKLKTYLIFN